MRTLAKVKSSAMMPRQPSVPNLMGAVRFADGDMRVLALAFKESILTSEEQVTP
jgi:hypothetical protein